MVSKEEMIGRCNHFKHEDDPEVDPDTFSWKGCWSCPHFSWEDPKPLIDVEEASTLFDVSKSTIRRWIRKDKVKAKLYVQGRHTYSLPAPKKYFIKRSDLKKFAKDELDKEIDSNQLAIKGH